MTSPPMRVKSSSSLFVADMHGWASARDPAAWVGGGRASLFPCTLVQDVQEKWVVVGTGMGTGEGRGAMGNGGRLADIQVATGSVLCADS